MVLNSPPNYLCSRSPRVCLKNSARNLELLSEANSAADCVDRALARTIVPVLPRVLQRDGKNILTIPEDAGYGPASEVVG